jgi:hypothetical protein
MLERKNLSEVRNVGEVGRHVKDSIVSYERDVCKSFLMM